MEGRLAYKDALEPPLLIIVPNKHQHIVAHSAAAGRRLVMTSIQRVYLRPHPMLSPFQQQRFLTSARHGTVDTAAQLHVCRGARGKGQPNLLKGITGDTVNAERADVAFPVTTQ